MRSRFHLLILLTLVVFLLGVVNLATPTGRAVPEPLTIFRQTVTHIDDAVQKTLNKAQLGLEFNRVSFERISQLLNMIPTGKSTLSMIEKYDIDVGFESGEGSRFIPSTNQIIIDSNQGELLAALTLVHEVTHARFFHDGSASNVLSVDRKEFVKKKVEEELNAVGSSIEAQMELEAAGVDTSNMNGPLESLYRQAYEKVMGSSGAGDTRPDDQALQSLARTAGRMRVFIALMNGQVVTSNTQQTYPDYWGSEWDKQNDTL
jgi:hypothetical protein